MDDMTHEAWLAELIGTDSMRTASQKTEYAQTTISRQLSRGHLSPEMIISLCRAYDRSPVTGLIETGYINDFELQGPDVEVALREATNEQLLNEIMRRSDPEARYLFGSDGDDDVIGLDPSIAPVSSLDDARSNGADSDVHSLPYAADSSDTEPEPGDDDYHDGP